MFNSFDHQDKKERKVYLKQANNFLLDIDELCRMHGISIDQAIKAIEIMEIRKKNLTDTSSDEPQRKFTGIHNFRSN